MTSNHALTRLKSHKLELKPLVKCLLFLYNSFCLAPFSMYNNGNIVISHVKFTFFTVILSCLLGFELYEIIVETLGSLGGKTNLFFLVVTVRFYSLSLNLMGTLINAVLIAPRHLVRFYNICYRLNHYFPLSYESWRYTLGGFVALALYATECFVYNNFRYKEKHPPGELLKIIFVQSNSLYIHCVALAIDFLFVLTCLLNHHYFTKINSTLKEGANLELQNINLFLRRSSEKDLSYAFLRELFGLACDTKNHLHSAFKVHLFLFVTGAFVDCTTMIYVVIETSSRNEPQDEERILFYAWCTCIFSKLAVITTLAEFLNSDVDNIAVEVHRQFNVTSDITTKSELMAFSQEIIHRKTALTALNFFSVDYELFPKMIGTISTYIIILFQFRSAREGSQHSNSYKNT